ncbi:MAG: ATP-binding protein [Alphaproteobacteria bacterium]|nr:ATP-binding protein [Alphaproteobacteria bacterium]
MASEREARPEEEEAAQRLSDQALENLVNQFARPLDFLRELVQNSVDAGSPRVEVRALYREQEGVLELGVQDWGEGMDEEIIDNHLTRLFSSTKEDDLTRIGKFGIGFTSVFALRPEAVLVRTGRHDESWELLFHSDRSYDKVRAKEPIHGTNITLFKKLDKQNAEMLIRDSAWTLRWWCEHMDTPVLLRLEEAHDHTSDTDSEDPFAAFAAPAPEPVLEAISRPLDLDASPALHHVSPLAEVFIGYARRPRYAFYNGGLTLVNTASEEVLGRLRERLGHLAFKVKSRHLEHTLTRDNVIRDGAWWRVMQVVVEAADRLREQLREEASAALQAGEPVEAWHTRLRQELEAEGGARWAHQLREQPLFRCWGGEVVSVEALERQEDLHGLIPMAVGPRPLLDALREERLLLVEDAPATRALLEAWPSGALRLLRPRRVEDAERRWVLPRGALEGELDPGLQRLLDATQGLLRAGSRGRLQLRAVRMGGHGALALEGPDEDRVFSRGRPSLLSPPARLRWRTLLVDADHPSLTALRRASLVSLDAAAFALAQSILASVDEPSAAAALLSVPLEA